MEQKKPLKRHAALQPLSRQHHFGLLFSWKLRKGFAKDIEISRLQRYAKWFFETEIEPHFDDEEKYVFSIMESGNELVERALKEHRRIKRLFNDTEDPLKSLHQLEEELDAHIRFEERILFNVVQNVATEEQLAKIAEIHQEPVVPPNYDDEFWED